MKKEVFICDCCKKQFEKKYIFGELDICMITIDGEPKKQKIRLDDLCQKCITTIYSDIEKTLKKIKK